MKLGVSTLGCPDWTLEEILTRLPAYGYAGVELRGIGQDLDLTQSPHFATPAAAERTGEKFVGAGLALCALDTSCSFVAADPVIRAQNVAAGQAAIDLAATLRVPTVRVFGGSIADGMARAEGARFLAESLFALGEYAASASGEVCVVLETHDSFSTGTQAAEALRLADHPRVGALWDLHHPFRHGETPAETFAALGPYVKQVHVKDSRPGGSYCLLGEGDIPIFDMLRLLRSGGFDGWINLEWEKRWIPELAGPEIAFPQYAARLREFLLQE